MTITKKKSKNKKAALEQENMTIIKLLFKGYSNSQIAKKLGYSTPTVVYRLNKIFRENKAKNQINFTAIFFTKTLNKLKKENKMKDKKIKELENTLNSLIKFAQMINSKLHLQAIEKLIMRAKSVKN